MTAPPAAPSGRWKWNAGSLVAAALSLVAFAYLAFAPAIFNDGDTSWHLAAGRLILEQRSVPDADPFSFTAAGQPWVAHEWLAEVLMALAFGFGSWGGLALLTAAAVAALLFIIGNEARRFLAPAGVAVAMMAVFILLTPFMLARPHVLAWPLLAGWTVLLLRARERDRAPGLAWALVMLLWANLHGSFLFGLLLIGPFALEALVASGERARTALRWGVFGLLSLLASLATPHGIHGLLFPLQVSGMESLPMIVEWRPTDLLEAKPFTPMLAAAIAFAFYKRVRVPPIRLLLLAALLFLAFQHVRHQAVLAILAPLLLARPFGEALARAPEERSDGGPAWAVPVLLMAALAAAALRIAVPQVPSDSQSNPRTAIARLPAELRGMPVFNSYGLGGPLILSGIRPYVDGRADMYGDRFMFGYQRIHGGDLAAFESAARRYGIGWTILEPSAPLAARLDRLPGWRRVYGDRFAVIHVKSSG